MRGGLTRRTILASGLLAVLVGAAFAVLVGAIAEERDSAALATRSQEVLAGANELERLVLAGIAPVASPEPSLDAPGEVQTLARQAEQQELLDRIVAERLDEIAGALRPASMRGRC